MIRALLLAALLTACGGGGASVERAGLARLLFEQGQTVLINDPGSEAQFPRDTGFVATFDLGKQSITDDARGVGIVNDSRGTNAVQIKTANLSWMPSAQIKPWAKGDARVCTSFVASVPSSQMLGSLGNYVGADIWLSAPSGRRLIVTAWIFDDGRVLPADMPVFDAPWINAVQLSGAIGRSSYFTTTAGTQSTTTWAEPRAFSFCINRGQAVALFAKAGIEADISQVALSQALLSNETNVGQGQSVMSTFFSAWTVTLGELR